MKTRMLLALACCSAWALAAGAAQAAPASDPAGLAPAASHNAAPRVAVNGTTTAETRPAEDIRLAELAVACAAAEVAAGGDNPCIDCDSAPGTCVQGARTCPQYCLRRVGIYNGICHAECSCCVCPEVRRR